MLGSNDYGWTPAKAQREATLTAPTGSDASIKPEMSDEELANKLMCVLTQEMIRKSELFDYLCWLEEKEQGERVPEADFLVLASDGRTCWGKSYAAAVAAAMKYDATPYGEHQNDDSETLVADPK